MKKPASSLYHATSNCSKCKYKRNYKIIVSYKHLKVSNSRRLKALFFFTFSAFIFNFPSGKEDKYSLRCLRSDIFIKFSFFLDFLDHVTIGYNFSLFCLWVVANYLGKNMENVCCYMSWQLSFTYDIKHCAILVDF